MKCQYCDNEIPVNAVNCPSCGAAIPQVPRMPNPPPYQNAQQFQNPPPYQNAQQFQNTQINTWMVPSVLVTALCCVPLGIVAIVFASRANSALTAGNYQLAQENANKAKTWFWAALIGGFVFSVFWIIVQVAAD